MKDNSVLPVVLCGGEGTRLWPLSRSSYPKQFLSLTEDKENTFLQETLNRVKGLEGLIQPILICNENHRFIVAEQLRKKNIIPNSIFLEPVGRNTAPAIVIAALKAIEDGNDPNLLVLSADHLIKNSAKFRDSIRIGLKYSANNKLVTFGVCPDYPETGYGYIRVDRKIDHEETKGLKINSFVEKPNLSKAKEFISCKKYFWNSGIFLFKASLIINEIKRLCPDIYSLCLEAFINSNKDLDFLRICKDQFLKCPNISIDKAVLEKTNQGIVIPMNNGWSDVGNWNSLWKHSSKNQNGNLFSGKVLAEKVKNSLIMSENRLVVGLGLKDIVIVETNDSVLVANKKNSQDIKKLVELLNEKDFPEGKKHKEVFRPWGSYLSLAEGKGWQVKRINVSPEQSLSLQSHKFRTEHWIIVSGIAEIELEGGKYTLKENESTYIPLGHKHRLSNPQKTPLVLIEVQSGTYLGEDDIERYEDKYGRNKYL